MNLREFRKTYNLDLLPVSNEGIILGTLVKDTIWSKPDLNPSGIPNSIYGALLDLNIINEEKFNQILQGIKNTKKEQAAFSQISIESDIDSEINLGIPKIGEIATKFKNHKEISFSFQNSKRIAYSDLQRYELKKYLDEIKKIDWDVYDKKLRRSWLITELYYAEVSIKIAKSLEVELKAEIDVLDLSPLKFESTNSIEYVFQNTLPFAMELEEIKGFN